MYSCPTPSGVQAEHIYPTKAGLWVNDELFHSTSTITLPLHHGEDAARGLQGRGVRELQVSLADAAC